MVARVSLLLLPLSLAPAVAHAATLDVVVRGADGKPLPGAVVMVDAARKPAGPIRFPWPYVMAQQNISFQPHILIVPVGASVTFPNRDKVRHHVYSFSKPKKFELKLYGREEARAVTFDKPGVVSLGCNIHDQMSGFIMVVETPYAALTDAQGHVLLIDLPSGAATLRVWHPAAKLPNNELAQPIAVPAGGTLAKVVPLPVRGP